MKNKLLAICAVLVLCSCSTKHEAGTITPSEMKEDYEIMWTMIEENVAALPAFKTRYNKDYKKIRDTYQSKLPSNTVSLQKYYDFITECLDEFKDDDGLPFAHISTLNYSELQNFIPIATSFSDQSLDINKNKNLKSTYEKSIEYSDDLRKYQTLFDISSYNNNSLLYIKINNNNHYNISAHQSLLKKYLDDTSIYESIIIDYRNNGGGNDLYWANTFLKPLMKENLTINYLHKTYTTKISAEYMQTSAFNSKQTYLCSELSIKNCNNSTIYKSEFTLPLDSDSYDGKDKISNIILLTNRTTFSSSSNFAYVAKSTGFATVVGESTGDSMCSSPLAFALKNSGIAIRMNVITQINEDGSLVEDTGITPNIEYTFNSDPDEVMSEEEAIEILNIVKNNN